MAPEKVTFSREKVVFTFLKVTFSREKVTFSDEKMTFRIVKVTFSALKVTFSYINMRIIMQFVLFYFLMITLRAVPSDPTTIFSPRCNCWRRRPEGL